MNKWRNNISNFEKNSIYLLCGIVGFISTSSSMNVIMYCLLLVLSHCSSHTRRLWNIVPQEGCREELEPSWADCSITPDVQQSSPSSLRVRSTNASGFIYLFLHPHLGSWGYDLTRQGVEKSFSFFWWVFTPVFSFKAKCSKIASAGQSIARRTGKSWC